MFSVREPYVFATGNIGFAVGKRRKRTRKNKKRFLRKYLPDQTGHQQIIEEAMEYSLMAGGKRLRPMLMKETF